MTATRLEAFSDAVLAMVITIMVLEELHAPEGADWRALAWSWKELASPIGGAAGIPASIRWLLVGVAAYAAVALMRLVPERRVERALRHARS